MSDPSTPESQTNIQPSADVEESFGDILSQHEKSRTRKAEDTGKGREGTVIAVTADSVLVDIGFKSEGILPLAVFQEKGESVKPGDKLLVTIKGRNPDGYYELSRGKVARPTDWPALEKAFAEKATILGTVSAVVKGGLSVDVGVRAFMPASRSGTRDAAEMEKLIGQEIRCRITKLDVTEEDVVVDRRAIAEEEERAARDRRYGELKEGSTLSGVVRSLTDYGAFVDIGGVDALLHVGDISWGRVNKPSDVLTVGQQIEVQVLKIGGEAEKRRISVGMKQLEPHPWEAVPEKYKTGERVRGAVTRVADFGAFVELEPGVEGLIHISEMSWAKKVRRPSDLVKPGETVEAVILGVNSGERRISLGLKQALGDPWAEVAQKFPVGSAVEGPVTSITKFGAFVQLAEGVEGMIHVSEMSAEKRINHPQDMLRLGQTVKTQVIAIDKEKRQVKLSIKQLVPTGLDEYLAEHKEGDVVTGRMVDVSGGSARVELGEGVLATCRMSASSTGKAEAAQAQSASLETKSDLSALTSMLQARWKSGGSPHSSSSKPQAARAGEIRSFRIARLDAAGKRIELELA
jgi:small subunit ribosomal protein S1